jgi:outer membrane immunogenic protein
MKKVYIACISAAALCGAAANAAEPAAYNWTGFYAGVNAGGSIGRDPTTQLDATRGLVLGSFTMSPSGFVGGGQIGYNWQFAPNWVVGLEGDVQGTSQSDSSCSGDCSGTGGGFRFTATQKLNWFATARARLGYTNGDWLWYATGGGAWGEIHNDFLVFTPTDAAGSANFSQSGWVIGGGVETHLRGGWTAKAEYLYMDLGSFTDVVPDPLTGHIFTMTSDVRDHIVRIGLNYHFNGPVVARY